MEIAGLVRIVLYGLKPIARIEVLDFWIFRRIKRAMNPTQRLIHIFCVLLGIAFVRDIFPDGFWMWPKFEVPEFLQDLGAHPGVAVWQNFYFDAVDISL
jgi:hypothetical protein